MSRIPSITFVKPGQPKGESVVLLVADGDVLGDAAMDIDPQRVVSQALAVADFGAGLGKSVDILVPAGTPFDRIVAFGVGKPDELGDHAWTRLGGAIGGHFRKAENVTIVLDLKDRD